MLAYSIASTAISLIILLIPRALKNLDKQHLLTKVVSLAFNAAAVAVKTRKTPYKAIQLFKLGCKVIVRSINKIRANISDFKHKYPKLTKEYIKF